MEDIAARAMPRAFKGSVDALSEAGGWHGAVMSEQHRTVTIERLEKGRYVARNARGVEMTFGAAGAEEFTPTELLLVAIAGCTGADVDYITSKRAEPVAFVVTGEGDKVRDDEGNRMENLRVTFAVEFPEGEGGDAARAVLPDAMRKSHDRLCTVSRTIERGTPIASLAVDGRSRAAAQEPQG